MLWAEAVHTCKHVKNSMATTGTTKSIFGIFYGKTPKMIGLFSELGCPMSLKGTILISKWRTIQGNYGRVCNQSHKRYVQSVQY